MTRPGMPVVNAVNVMSAVLIVLLVLPAVPSRAEEPADAATWMERARERAYASRHDEARAAVDSVLVRDPGHYGARLLRTRLDAWDGRYDEAAAGLSELLAERPGDPAARQARAYLLYYRGRLSRAEAEFEALARENPADGDVRRGLAAVRRALDAPRHRLWRADAGAEYSTFSRRALDDWHQQFVQLSRRLDSGRTTVFGRADLFNQFGLTDAALEAGAARSFSPHLNGVFSAGATVAPDFRPAWRVRGEAAWRAWPTPGGAAPGAVWLLAEARYDAYEDVGVAVLNPGVRLVRESWEGTVRLSRVTADGRGALHGWSTRLDGPLGPAAGAAGIRAGFWAGLADAPETVSGAAGSVTVSTRTVFTGVRADIAGAWFLNAGYARDDRENSWIRHNLHASVARLF